jgi:hypothetical protein
MNDNQPPTHGIDRRTALSLLAAVAAGGLILPDSSAPAAGSLPENDEILQPGKFPAKPGNYLAGELVTIDAINRRGGLRLDGDFNDDRYDKAQPHEFAMLPYGMIYYHGAPAELRDIPLGTHLHGSFYLPPKGEEATIPPTKGPPQYGSKFNHAILLEDDFSYFQRRGQAWEVVEANREKGRMKVAASGKSVGSNFEAEHTLWIDDATRVWQGKSSAEWTELAAGQLVQLNLTWSPEWRNRQFRVMDVWIDEESRSVAAERQRRNHVHYQKHRWLAGWIDHVEHLGGSKGIVTITLFGGMDSSLYETGIKPHDTVHPYVALAVSETTLRTYWADHDQKNGPITDVKVLKSPPVGSSGIQFRWHGDELLDGFRPGRIVRCRPNHWPNTKLPPEERLR